MRSWTKPLAYGAVYLGWGTTYLAIRVGVRGLPPAAFLGARFLFASTVLAAALAARPGGLRRIFHAASGKEVLHSATQGWLLLVAGLLPMAYSELTLPSSVTAIVIGCAPAGFALFDRVLNGTRVRGATVAALVLGVSGIALLGSGGGSSPAALNPRGLAFVILGCSMWCFGSVASKRLKPVREPLLNVLIQYLASGLVLSLIAFFVEGFPPTELVHAGRETFISLGYIALGPSLISYTSYLWLLRNEPSARVSTYAFVNPVIAVFAGALLLGESAGASVLGALVLVLAGTALQFGVIPVRRFSWRPKFARKLARG